jgi:CheY-like chemotaxis protein
VKTILIIEDDAAISTMLADLLSDVGYGVRTAANGREGIAALAEGLPALILCDVMMPILDGRAVCRHLQTTPRYQAIPLVMMSAGMISLHECHAHAYLAKPFDILAVLALIQRLIGAPDIVSDKQPT